MSEFRIRYVHFLPILVVILISTALAAILQYAYQVPPTTVTPFPESGSGPILNGIYFVASMGAAATGIYLLMRRGLKNTLKAVMIAVYALVSFSLANLYLPVLLFLIGILDAFFTQPVLLGGTLILAITAVYLVFFHKGKAQTATVLFFGSALGAVLGFAVPTTSAIVILSMLAAYDVFAVFKGPVGKLIKDREGKGIEGLTIVIGELEIGLGDFVFYSMLAAHVFLFLGLVQFLTALIGVLFGAYLTFLGLARHRMLPGLPFSLALGMVLAFGTNYLLGI